MCRYKERIYTLCSKRTWVGRVGSSLAGLATLVVVRVFITQGGRFQYGLCTGFLKGGKFLKNISMHTVLCKMRWKAHWRLIAIKKTPTSKLAVIFMQHQFKQSMLSSKMSSPLTSKNCIICLMPGWCTHMSCLLEEVRTYHFWREPRGHTRIDLQCTTTKRKIIHF